MRLVTYTFRGEQRLGVLDSGYVVDVNRAVALWLQRSGHPRPQAEAAAVAPPDMIGFLESGDRGAEALRAALGVVREELAAEAGGTADSAGPAALAHNGTLFRQEEVQLRAPVPQPRKILCLGMNYRDHAEEFGLSVPEVPVLFPKFANCVIGPGEPIVLPPESHEVDYEAELGVLIGRRARRVAAEQAYEVIAGYTVLNDVSARDYQTRTSQWTAGKVFDTFLPMGPALVTKDEVPDPHRLAIGLTIGNEVLQDSNTRHLIFRVPEIVAFISSILTLEPGDVIATGTPSGVGFKRNPPRLLRAGDVVRVHIEGVGELVNPVVG